MNDIAVGLGGLYLFVGSDTSSAELQVVDIETLANPQILGGLNLTGLNYLNGVIWDFDANRIFGAGEKNDAELAVIQPSL